MPGKTGLFSEGTNENGIAFHIYDIYNPFSSQPKLFFRNFQNNTIPLVIPFMPQYSVPIIPRIVRLCSINFFYP